MAQTSIKIFSKFSQNNGLFKQTLRSASGFQPGKSCDKKKSCKEPQRGPCKPREIPIPRLDCKTKKIVVPSCIQGSLPCCPDVRIPPDCNVPQPPPTCDRIPVPMKSMSQLMRSLPDKPFTECDCWLPKPKICSKRRVGSCKSAE